MTPSDSMINTGQQITTTGGANAIATTTIPASGGQNAYRPYLMGWVAYYSAAVAAIKNVTVVYYEPVGTANNNVATEPIQRTVTFPWDFTAGAFYYSLPIDLVGSQQKAMTVSLDAGGGVITGTVTAFFSLR